MNSALRQLPLMISVTLIAAVAYALVIEPARDSTGQESRQIKAEILGELAAFESRLEQQVVNLNLQAQSAHGSSNAAAENHQIAMLSQQVNLILQRQERYQKRLEALENRLLSQLGEDGVLEQAEFATDIFSVARDGMSGPQTADNLDRSAQQNQSDELAMRRIELQISNYEDALFKEEPDVGWATTVKQKIVNVINDTEQLRGVHVQSSDCGTSLCKLEVYVEEGESVEEKVQMLMANRPWQGESFVSFEFDGHGAIFFAREGAELP